eukprot:4296556-Alexandrium_andersonii.AAC.1
MCVARIPNSRAAVQEPAIQSPQKPTMQSPCIIASPHSCVRRWQTRQGQPPTQGPPALGGWVVCLRGE